MNFQNMYEDTRRAEAYAGLEFADTYHLAYRDLPRIFRRAATRGRALDFGCGAGRSTRFLRELGFETVGVDIASAMIERARRIDPPGDYRLIADGDFSSLGEQRFDAILCAFPFDNIAGAENKIRLLVGLRELLTDGAFIVNLVSSPEIYTHEWASFTTRDFPENRQARRGDRVRIITKDGDPRPFEDIFWTDDDYCDVYEKAGLVVKEAHRPLASDEEPYAWISETTVAPWVIYVLEKR